MLLQVVALSKTLVRLNFSVFLFTSITLNKWLTVKLIFSIAIFSVLILLETYFDNCNSMLDTRQFYKILLKTEGFLFRMSLICENCSTILEATEYCSLLIMDNKTISDIWGEFMFQWMLVALKHRMSNNVFSLLLSGIFITIKQKK